MVLSQVRVNILLLITHQIEPEGEIMQLSEKLLKPVIEMKYLNADNVDRYRSIMRIFYEQYEKLKYWLYQEDVYEQMTANDYFSDYKPVSRTRRIA